MARDPELTRLRSRIQVLEVQLDEIRQAVSDLEKSHELADVPAACNHIKRVIDGKVSLPVWTEEMAEEHDAQQAYIDWLDSMSMDERQHWIESQKYD